MSQDRFSYRFYFVHESGDKLHPVRMESRATKSLTFRICPPDLTKEHSYEAEEEEMVRMVLTHGYKVRMASIDNPARHSLYNPNGRSIREVVT